MTTGCRRASTISVRARAALADRRVSGRGQRIAVHRASARSSPPASRGTHQGALAPGPTADGQPFDGRHGLSTLVESDRCEAGRRRESGCALRPDAGALSSGCSSGRGAVPRLQGPGPSPRSSLPSLTGLTQHLTQRACRVVDLMGIARCPRPAVVRGLRLLFVRPAASARSAAGFTGAAAAPPRVLAAGQHWAAVDRNALPTAGGRANPPVLERMEYGFSIAARTSAGEMVVSANRVWLRRIDWHDFE